MENQILNKEGNKARDCAACTFGVPETGYRISWEITHRCNLNCKHCCVSAGPDSKEYYSKDDITRIMRDLAKSNVKKIYLTGGEPLLFKHVFHLLKIATELNINVKIASNGSCITNKIAKKLLRYDIHSILISLDSPSPMQHNEFRGNESSFISSCKAIRLLVANGISVKISTVLWKGNLDKIEDMINLAIGLGAYKLYFSWLIPVGRSMLNEDIMSDPNDFVQTKDNLLKLIKKYEGQIQIHVRRTFEITDSDDSCPGALKLFHVDNKGYVSPCSWIAKGDTNFVSKSSIIESRFLDIINNDPNLINFRKQVQTYTDNYGPGCPAISKLTYGNYKNFDKLYKGKKHKRKNILNVIDGDYGYQF